MVSGGSRVVVGGAAVLPCAVAPVRREPHHRAELVSQWVLGESIAIEALEGTWLRGRGPDGYTGWTPAAPFRNAVFSASEWEEAAKLRSIGTSLLGTSGLERLPWGARLWPGAAGESVVLPDGRAVTPTEPDRVVTAAGAARRGEDPLPTAPDAAVERVTRLATQWVGVTYLWGGRTELGVDCSGLVQAVYATVGVKLPRDSHQQYEADPDLGSDGGAPEPGDLVFFAPEGAAITHVAMSLGGSRIIHCASTNGRVAEDDLEANDPLAGLLSRSIVGLTRPAER